MKIKISVIKPPLKLIRLLLPAIFLLVVAVLALPALKPLPDIYGLLLRSAGLAAGAPAPVTEEAREEAPQTPPEETLLVIAQAKPSMPGPPQAVVYCTHTSEEYRGQSRVKGVPGGVLEAARALAEALEAQGIGVIFDQTVHDESYDDAYAHSLASLEEIAAAHPEIRLYIDVHRDSAIAGISTTLRAQDQDYAKMLLIVGSDERLPHENWERNHAFARQVAESANRLLPGVMREPRVYSARYNQHIGDRAILVEIGSTDNSQEEAERSARLLAEAIAESL